MYCDVMEFMYCDVVDDLNEMFDFGDDVEWVFG